MSLVRVGTPFKAVLPTRKIQHKRIVNVRAEGGDKVTREFREGDESVSVNDSAKKEPKMNPDGTYYADELPVPQDTMSKDMKQKLRKEYIEFGGSPDQPLQSNPFLLIVVGIGALALICAALGYI